MIKNFRKISALVVVPVIAVLITYLLGFLQDYAINWRGRLASHDEYYLVPYLTVYLISIYVLGFLPAIAMQKFTGRFLAAATPAVAITLYHLIQLYLDGFYSFVSVSSIVAYYPFAWFFALLIGLTIWHSE